MKINILCVGRIKEKFYRDAVDEYVKRLGRYADLKIIEVKDEPAPEKLSAKQEEAVIDTEGEKLLKYMDKSDRIYALAIDGKMYSSEGFAKKIEDDMGTGYSSISFVIGGSLGLSKKVLTKADEKISFSKMTFPHQLMRVILLEQIYRGYRIIKNEPYHK